MQSIRTMMCTRNGENAAGACVDATNAIHPKKCCARQVTEMQRTGVWTQRMHFKPPDGLGQRFGAKHRRAVVREGLADDVLLFVAGSKRISSPCRQPPPALAPALQTRAHRLRRPLHTNELRRFSSLQTRAAALQTRVQPIASGICATHLWRCGGFFSWEAGF